MICSPAKGSGRNVGELLAAAALRHAERHVAFEIHSAPFRVTRFQNLIASSLSLAAARSDASFDIDVLRPQRRTLAGMRS